MRKFGTWLMVLGAAALGLAAVPNVGAQANAKVRVIHASPDAPAVDVLVNGNAALRNVPFFTASDYLDLPAGTYDLAVVPTGATEPKVIDAKGVRIEAGKAYTVAAVGQLANIKAQIFEDNLAAPAAGKAHVRVYHLSPDAPAVDVKVANGPTLVPALAFPNASNYLPVDAGTYNLQVTPAGQSAVVLDLPNTQLEAGKIYDVFANGLLANIKVNIATPAPAAAAPAAAAPAPGRLPTTGGENPAILFGAVAALFLVAGAVLRRRAQ